VASTIRGIKSAQFFKVEITKQRIVRLPVILLAFAATIFFVTSSRPTADEYLLGPMFNGFYVDQPETLQFLPNPNFLVRYVQAAHAMVRLGWDGWLNALTFQTGSAVLVNYFGPLSTMVQGAVLSLLTWFLLHQIVRNVTRVKEFQIAITASIYLLLVANFAVADFNTNRENFGLFPFLGIRFGLYFVHGLALLALLIHIQSASTMRRKVPSRATVIWLGLFSGFVSLWYIMYFFIFIGVQILFVWRDSAMRRIGLISISIVAVCTYIFHQGLRGARARTVNSTEPVWKVISTFVRDYLLDANSRIFDIELWRTIVGPHALLAVILGFLVGTTVTADCWNQQRIRKIVQRFSLGIPAVPVAFAFQEYLTYEAWWHRTTPIVISSVYFAIVGLLLSTSLRTLVLRPKFLTVVLTTILVVIAPAISKRLYEIDRFRDSWDSGNILGIGSPVFNDENYNVTNVLHLRPYTMRAWDVQSRLLGQLPVVVEYLDDDGEIVDQEDTHSIVRLSTLSGPFDTEFGGNLRFRLSVKTDCIQPLIIDVDGSARQVRTPVGVEVVGTLVHPGGISIANNANCHRNPAVEIDSFDVGLSGSLAERFKVGSADYFRHELP
jgi:hypothetical protein